MNVQEDVSIKIYLFWIITIFYFIDIIEFDNFYSWFSPKQLKYTIDIIDDDCDN